jgi:hypothetical protein
MIGDRMHLVCLLDRIFPRLRSIYSMNMGDGLLRTLDELRELGKEGRLRLAQEIESRTS